MEELIKIYESRIRLLKAMIRHAYPNTDVERLNIKLGCYRSFLQDLKQTNIDMAESGASHKQIDAKRHLFSDPRIYIGFAIGAAIAMLSMSGLLPI